MPTPPALLPPARKLIDEYVQQDLTMRQIASKYDCSLKTAQNRLKKAAVELGMTWPLKSELKARSGRAGTVTTKMLRAEIVYCIQRYRITQTQLAEACGIPANHMHQITAGFRSHVKLATARKIQAGIEKVEAGKITPAVGRQAVLPKHVRTHCINGHPYTGRRDAKGRRICSVCQANKHRRGELKKRQARASAA